MFLRVVALFVHAKHYGYVFVGGGRRYDDLLCAVLDVLAGLRRVSEYAGAFQHDVHAQLAPAQVVEVALRQRPDGTLVNHNQLVCHFHAARKDAVSGVVLEQVGIRFRIDRIVDSHHLKYIGVALHSRAQHLPADAPESVNSYASCHMPRNSFPVVAVFIASMPFALRRAERDAANLGCRLDLASIISLNAPLSQTGAALRRRRGLPPAYLSVTYRA